MTLATRLFTLFRGQLVGADQFGNRYYQDRLRARKHERRKRWVMYKGKPEASKVPADWHGWLHYTLDTPPTKRTVYHHDWEKPHLPNLTGTVNAYVPPGHLRLGGKRAKSTADYEAWRP